MDFEIGSDIVEVKRIKEGLERFGERFAKRILTEREMKEFEKRKDKAIFLASRFAAKEAIYKAVNIKPFSWHRIEVLKDNGKPEVFIDGKLRKDLKITISHEREYAIAFCVLIK